MKLKRLKRDTVGYCTGCECIQGNICKYFKNHITYDPMFRFCTRIAKYIKTHSFTAEICYHPMLLKRSWILQENDKKIKLTRQNIYNYNIRYAFCVGCKCFSFSQSCKASEKINKVCRKYRKWINDNLPKMPPTYIICS